MAPLDQNSTVSASAKQDRAAHAGALEHSSPEHAIGGPESAELEALASSLRPFAGGADRRMLEAHLKE
jgi:hypothetical protein